ncbi:double-stranded RNA-specific editase B2-like isoform X2 [Ostrinia nubilalis]|uniref:double-stranded RNA-specific editase B2-like isoform X2 n=1 Tax=Ostrinia nubilalis TaxID=29057 RepID=UPI0030822551
MVFNNKYNTRHSGRYNTAGQFVSAGVNQQLTPPPQHPQQPPLRQPHQAAPGAKPSIAQQAIVKPDVEMKVEGSVEGSEDGAARPHWMKAKLPGVKKLSKREKRRRQNEHLRRIITPKNALMVLNEMMLHEQLTNVSQQFKVEPADPPAQYFKAPKTSFCADLTLDGVTYKGYGENKLMARNAAAEQAIRDLIIKRMNRAAAAGLDASVEGTARLLFPKAANPESAMESLQDDDPLPMIQLASYALHKLFSEWEYDGHKVPQLRPASASASEAEGEASSAPGPRRAAKKPPKELPLNAAAMHPCMLLTYMRPHLEYRELAAEGDRPQNMLFTMGVDVDGATYIGKASNKKEARKAAAKSACQALFNVKFEDVATANAPVVAPAPTAMATA